MNKNAYLILTLAACLGLASVPLFAEVAPAPEYPANLMAPTTSPAEHHKSIAAEYKKVGRHELHKHYAAIASHHEALAKEHEKTAATYEKMAK